METTPKPAEAPKPKSNTWKLIAIVVVILIVVGVAAYILTIKPATTANIIIQDDNACGATPPDTACLFNPASFNATVNGSAVVWKNNGGVLHTVTTNATLDGSLPSINSNVGQNGGTYSYAFTAAGTYHYYCSIHPWMKGVVIAK